MTPECAHDDVLRLALARLVDLDREVIAAGAAARETYVAHRGKAALQVFQQRRLARNAAEQEMLHSAADDGVKDRILAVRDRIDLNDFAVGARTVILRKLAERPFGLAHLGQDTAFDDDFRMTRARGPGWYGI